MPVIQRARTFRRLVFGGALSLAACASSGSTRRSPETSTTPPPTEGDAGPPVSAENEGSVPITVDEICRAAVDARAAALPDRKPFSAPDPRCTGADPFCDRVEKSPSPADACFVADDNLARARRDSRRMGVLAASVPWDGTTTPKYLDRIDDHLHFTREERDKLWKNGFVVLDRFAYTDYATAFHDVFQQQLPLFVGVDPILHAVYRGTELALERVERKRLVPALRSLLRKLRRGLAASKLAPETRVDLEVYLGVAWELLEDSSGANAPRPTAALGEDEVISRLVETAKGAGELSEVTLFGRPRVIDVSQLTPRGHYGPGAAGSPPDGTLEPYFRAMMWLSRVEFNIVSRSTRSSHPGPGLDPTETPREVRDALALAELVEQTGSAPEVRAFEEVYATFAGGREDIPPATLLEIARGSGLSKDDPDIADKLKVAIGGRFPRTARTHFTVEGAPFLPAITTLFGPRIVPDVAPLTRLVHDSVPDRTRLSAADVGYVLGHPRARAFLPDLDAFSGLEAELNAAKDDLRRTTRGRTDVYGTWLSAILAVGDEPTGAVPSFMKREAYADHRLDSALVGYGQLRHTFVLLAGQGYDAYGCEIPDAYVEPLPAVYDALRIHVRTLRSRAKGWDGLERVLETIATIAHAETSGRVLSEPQRRWLAMVSEHVPKGGFVDSGEPPKWTGWYFDMFDDREHGAVKGTSFLADYFTLTNSNAVAYLGAEGPRLGVFVVDTNGEPRAMVGPVAKGFEAAAPIAGRLDDAHAFAPDVAKKAPWRASYAVDRPAPELGLEAHVVRCETKGEWRVAIRGRRDAGPLTIALLDHHGDPLTAKLSMEGKRTWSVGAFDLPIELARSEWGVEAVHLHIDDLVRSGTGAGPYDLATSPSHFASWDHDERMPVRPRRTGSFAIGLPGGPTPLPATGSSSGPSAPDGF